jgi:hypothetical protein
MSRCVSVGEVFVTDILIANKGSGRFPLDMLLICDGQAVIPGRRILHNRRALGSATKMTF